MFNIVEAAKTVSDVVEDHSVEGAAEHVYVVFDNGYILSALRGTHLGTGDTFGAGDGSLQTAVLIDGGVGALPGPENELPKEIADEAAFIAELERVKALPEAELPSLAQLLALLNLNGL